MYYRVPAAWECRLQWAGHVPPTAGLNRVDYAIWGPCRSESITAGRLTPFISWSRQSCWSVAHCQSAFINSFITFTASDNGNVVSTFQCVVDQYGEHIEHTYHTVCTVKLLLLQTLCWNIFRNIGHTTQLSLHIISLDQTYTYWYTWCPLASYAFINIK